MIPSLTKGAGALTRRAAVAVCLPLCALALWWARTADAARVPASARQVVCSTFKQGCEYALRIASCETGGTFNRRARGRAGERGWFQIHPVHFGSRLRSAAGSVVVDPDRLYDPAYNTRVAYVLSNGGRDWSPWSCRRYV